VDLDDLIQCLESQQSVTGGTAAEAHAQPTLTPAL
jgi:hypothetical protein